jgi:adenylate cyclase
MYMIGEKILHYKILEKLGEGGMGVVYKAQDTKLDRTVAIKFLPAHLATAKESKLRFIQEAQATAALNHPNILSVYDIDEQQDALFFVMEYIEGRTLKSYIANLKPGENVPVKQAIDWVIQIAQGLKAAHEKDIVHRDIKPENIMLTKEGNPKIMDFGIAKLKSSSGLTRTGTSLGTLSYMSPEQAQGVPADYRTDIWSLGVVLYEILTSDLPFKAEHEAGLQYLIINEDPPAPSVLDRRIPHQIDSVVLRMLSKNREQRYASMGELIKHLQEVRNDLDKAETTVKKKAIAVLPIENISSDKENEYFGVGLTDELIANLSRFKTIRVVPRTIIMQYKGTQKDVKTIGRELGTRYLLAGSVRKFQDDLRITVELIDIDEEEQIWAGTYKGKLADVFDIQEQVSKQIVDALMVKLSPTERIILTKRPTANAEAFDYNLRARNFLYRNTKNSFNLAIQLFTKAIELDPRYADAYAGLAEAHALHYASFERNESRLEKAIEYSLKALMYDSNLSEAYAALGLAYFYQEKYDEALTAINKAIENDPNNFFGYWILGRLYFTTDREREAIEPLEKVIELNPNFYTAYGDLRISYERIGNTEKTEETRKRAIALFPKYLAQNPDDARAHLFFALDLSKIGRLEEAKKEVATALELSPNDAVMLYNAACFYASNGETKRAIDSLRQALAAGFNQIVWIKRDPDLESIRKDPEYLELIKEK